MRTLFQILFSGQNRLPVIVACFGTFLGLIILLSSLHIFSEVQRSVDKRLEEQQQSSFLIINKQLGAFSMFGGGAASQFKEEEIEDFRNQDFVKSIGVFKSNNFRVIAGLGQTLGLQGDMFLEAVEDRYLDVIPDEWEWREGENFIPLLVSGEFMRLYNFSIAMSQNLPQVSPAMVQMISFDMKIPHNGKEEVYEARVVGFSDRLPTILVPYNFLEFANNTYGSGQDKQPSRIIIEVEDPGYPLIESYLAENNYETNKEALRAGTDVTIIRIVMTITGVIGILFLVLSLVLFIMNFQLILSRAKEEISMLLDLGYSPAYLNKVMLIQFLMIILPVVILATGIVYVGAISIRDFMEMSGWAFSSGLAQPVWITVFVFSVISILLNYIVVRQNIRSFYA